MATNPKITQIGLKKADTVVKRRLIVSVEAQEKSGKTNFLLTAPGPLAVFDFNNSLEGVVHKFAASKDIYISDYTKTGGALTPVDWKKTWDKFQKEYLASLKEPAVRTIGVDTATEMWELKRMGEFGKLLQVMPHMYPPVNAQFRDLIYAAYTSGKNLILTHKMKEEYVTSKANPAISNRTGKFIRAGFSDMAYMVQINLSLWHDADMGFVAKILDCRQNAEIVGMELYGDDINFPMLGSLVFPETDPQAWE